MELIDKSAVVAEIEKLKGKISDGSSYCNGYQHALRMLELSLNTIKLKEIDLEKEIASQYESNYDEYLRYEEFEDIAKHFFELGINARKE